MSIAIQPAPVSIYLQELLQPFTLQLSDPAGQDLSACTAVLKVRQSLASASAIVTLTSPADIQLSSSGIVSITFTSTHFSTLLAGLTLGDGVYDCVVYPFSGAPQMAASGLIGVRRTVSR